MAEATKRRIRFHLEGAACRAGAPTRPYVLVVYLHVFDGLGPKGWRPDIWLSTHPVAKRDSSLRHSLKPHTRHPVDSQPPYRCQVRIFPYEFSC